MYPFIEIGNLVIETYHILMVFGFLISIIVILIINKKNKQYMLPAKEILFLAAFIIFGALVGARILYVITQFNVIIDTPSLFLPMLINGGLVFYGGLIGGIGFGYFYMERYNLDPLKYSNLFVIALPLGHGCGRIGCFMAGCCHGKPTESIMGVVFPFEASYPYHDVKVHPTQLYEAVFNFLLFGTMVFLFFKFKDRHRPYIFISIYLVFYGIFRFINEFFRGDEIRGVYILSTSQWISILMIMIGTLLYIFKTNKANINKMVE
jgi:phosphatidylglycerol---prolipoprotein diacylglyceryl transferase